MWVTTTRVHSHKKFEPSTPLLKRIPMQNHFSRSRLWRHFSQKGQRLRSRPQVRLKTVPGTIRNCREKFGFFNFASRRSSQKPKKHFGLTKLKIRRKNPKTFHCVATCKLCMQPLWHFQCCTFCRFDGLYRLQMSSDRPEIFFACITHQGLHNATFPDFFRKILNFGIFVSVPVFGGFSC